MTDDDPGRKIAGFAGFRRAGHRAGQRSGVRSHILVLGINGLVMRAAERIAALCSGAVCVATPTGRGHLGADLRAQIAHFIGIGCNPNVAAVLVVGVEATLTRQVTEAIRAAGTPADSVSADAMNEDTLRLVETGLRLAARLARAASGRLRQDCPVSDLVLAVECGHSDATSGIACNPVVGAAVDRLLARGATVILGETVEWLGAEHLLARRARDAATAEALVAAVARREAQAQAAGVTLTGHNPGAENIRGGLTTIEEKALGAISKSGAARIEGLLALGEAPPGPGLHLMDGPSFSPESMTGFVAAGAQVILFTTGLGNAVGSLIAPTIKLSARPATAASLTEQIDFDVSAAWTGAEDIGQVADRLVAEVLAVCSGKLTWAEILGEGMETIPRLGASL